MNSRQGNGQPHRWSGFGTGLRWGIAPAGRAATRTGMPGLFDAEEAMPYAGRLKEIMA